MDTKTDYQKLAEKYRRIAKQVAEELQANKGVIGCAVVGSTATGDVHFLSDIDLIALVEGSSIYKWERRIVQNTMVNVLFRSKDNLEKMAREHPDTIFGLKGALILYDPQGILQSLKKEAEITEPVREELLGDLLDEARSFIGKAERALAEGDLESSILCLRHGAIKILEHELYKEKGNRVNPMRLWREIKALSLPRGLKGSFSEIQGFDDIERPWLIRMLKRLKTFLPEQRNEQ